MAESRSIVVLPEGVSPKLIRSAGIAAVLLAVAIPVSIAAISWFGVALILMMIPLWQRGIHPAPFWPKAWAGFVGAATLVFLIASNWKQGWGPYHGFGFLAYAYALWTLLSVAPEWKARVTKGFVYTCAVVAVLVLVQTWGWLDFMAGLLWGEQGGRAGLFTNPILTAEMLLLALIVGWFTLRDWRGWWPLILVLLGGIVATGTKGVWVAVIAVVPFLAASLWQGWRLWVGALALVATFVGMVAESPIGHERITQMLHEMNATPDSIQQQISAGEGDNSTMSRLYLWKGAWILWQQHPLLGVGFGAFPDLVQELSDRGEIGPVGVNVHAHNLVVQWLVVQGIVGCGALLFLLAQPWVAAPRLLRPGPRWVQARMIMLATLLTGMTEVNLGWDAMMTAWSVCLVLAMAPDERPDKLESSPA